MQEPIIVEGTHNFRDIGGLPLVSGGETAHRVLYRSDALVALTPAGKLALVSAGIGTIVDLRSDAERTRTPDRLPEGLPVVTLPITAGDMGAAMSEAVGTDPAALTPQQIADALSSLPGLGDMYATMLTGARDRFAEIARIVAHADGAVLVHCTAGKDRTGIAVALLLDAVGAERDAVIADYASSETNLAATWAGQVERMLGALGITVTDALRTLAAGSPAAALSQAFGWVDERGGSAAYLRDAGVTSADLDALRGRLTR